MFDIRINCFGDSVISLFNSNCVLYFFDFNVVIHESDLCLCRIILTGLCFFPAQHTSCVSVG